MPRLFFALILLVLLTACGGDSDPPSITPPPTAVPSMTRTVEPTPSPTYGVVPLPAQPPARSVRLEPALELLEAPSDAETAPQLLFYSLQSNRITGITFDPTRGLSWGWTPSGAALVNATGGPVIYEPRTGNVQRLVIGDEVRQLRMGPATRAALQLMDGSLAILDLSAAQVQPLTLKAWPHSWSPDGKRLLVQVEGAGLAVVLLDTPVGRLYTLPTDGTLQYVGWTSDATLMAVRTTPATGASMAEVMDVSGPALRVTQRPFPLLAVSLHDGAIRLAAGDFGRPDVAIYDALSLRKERDLPGLILGPSHDSGGSLWSTDARRIVLTVNRCTAEERIVVVDVTSGVQIDVARAGPLQLAMSPDGSRVAYTADSSLYIVPSDASAAPRPVYGRAHGPAPIAWSPDGATVGFAHFYGGYGRCG